MVQIDPFAPQYFPVQPEGVCVGVGVALDVGVGITHLAKPIIPVQ